MRVLVDTSAWVDFLDGHPSAAGQAVSELVLGEEDLCTCGTVVAEVFQGLPRDQERNRLARLFCELTFLAPSGIESYFRAAALFRSLRRRGRTVRSTIDCLIATLAEENGCYLLARDRDMELIAASGLVNVRLWPLT